MTQLAKKCAEDYPAVDERIVLNTVVQQNLGVASRKELYLWWSGEAESMFVYYLTGAITIALIATLTITRSLRRNEPIVTELLHEDNARERLVSYMLKIVTCITPGSGCPESAKIFMQLTGERKMSQYFQLRSNTGGKAMLQRGFTDIFLFKVPESLGDIRSAELFVAGLDGPLKWKLENVQLYSPSKREWKTLPVTATLLEVLDPDATGNILVVSSSYGAWIRIQLLFHQWLAGYGNTVRLGAFTAVVHAMNVFVSLFTLLILSQICYICLPRGGNVTADAPSKIQFTDNVEEEDDTAVPFDIKISSLLIGAALTSAGCSLLTFCIEILLRSVKSNEKDPGKAYYNLCDKDIFSNETFEKKKIASSEVELKRDFITPLFLRSYTGEKDSSEDIIDKKHTSEVAFYLKQLINFLQTEHDQYMKKVEAIRKKKEQEAIKWELQMKRKQERKKEKEALKKEKQDKDRLKMQESPSLQERDEDTLNELEIDVPTFSEISLSPFYISESSLAPKTGESYLNVLKKRRLSNTSQKFFRLRGSSEQLEIPLDSNLRCLMYDDKDTENKLDICAEFDSNLNAVGDEFDNMAATGDGGKSDDCLIEIPESGQLSKHMPSSGETGKQLSNENFCRIHDWIGCSERSKASEKGFVLVWQANQKAWCRRVIKELCDIIRSTREMLISDELSFFQMQSTLLDNSHSVLQLLLVACSVHCNEEQYKILMNKEMLSLMWHMSMEILVNVLHEIFHVLQSRDSAVLADLVLQSHHVMHIVRHAVYPIMYMVQYGSNQLCLLRHIPLEKDLHCMTVELLKCCFELVVKYNLVLWQKLKILVNRELKGCLDVNCYIQLMEFIQCNIQDHCTENTVVKRLCNYVEESCREEAWDELHKEKKFYTNILVKLQVIKSLKRKITNLTKKKQRFDKANDLLPKEPKSRLQLLVEKRRKKPEVPAAQEERQCDPQQKQSKSTGKHVKWSKETQKEDSGTEKKEELEKQSMQLGHFVENLMVIYERLKKVMERQGISQSLKGSVLLAQAVLHPHVIVTLGEATVGGMYQFDNYLHLKRTENLLAQFYEATVKDLVDYLLNAVVTEYNLKSDQQVQFDTLVHDVSIKMDTMAEILSEDVEAMMHQCIKMEPNVVGSAEGSRSVQELLVKPSVNSLLQIPSIQKWSGLDLADCTPSEMSELGKMLEDDNMDMTELLEFYKNDNRADENNSNPGLLDTEDIHLEIHTPTWSLADIIEDLKPLKGYMEYLKHGETLRNIVTQMGHIERSKHKREYFNSVQINNIIDSYYMLDEGDDSQTLTKAGLYQLEHDCAGEDLKPLPSWVKTVTVMLMMLSLILIVVYITVTGGQFSTTELQEWMCYYLLAVAVFGLVLEQFRACAIALCARRLKQKVAPKIDRWKNFDVI